MGKSQAESKFFGLVSILGLPEPDREYRFTGLHVGIGKGLRTRLKEAGLKDWRFDFAWPDFKVAVEIQGVTKYGGKKKLGGHQTPKGIAEDCEKGNAANDLGWTVYHYTQDMICTDAVEQIRKALRRESDA